MGKQAPSAPKPDVICPICRGSGMTTWEKPMGNPPQMVFIPQCCQCEFGQRLFQRNQRLFQGDKAKPDADGVDDALNKNERHELECLRARIQQIEYPCSPHCDGYLRELALRNASHPPLSEAELREFVKQFFGQRWTYEFERAKQNDMIAFARAVEAKILNYNKPKEHNFGDTAFGKCNGCGKYVEELIDERYCKGK